MLNLVRWEWGGGVEEAGHPHIGGCVCFLHFPFFSPSPCPQPSKHPMPLGCLWVLNHLGNLFRKDILPFSSVFSNFPSILFSDNYALRSELSSVYSSLMFFPGMNLVCHVPLECHSSCLQGFSVPWQSCLMGCGTESRGKKSHWRTATQG